MDEWCVYIIQENPTLNIKIGYAKNINSRLSGIQVGNPRTLSLIFKENFPSEEQCRKPEKLLHSHLSFCALSGEWFEYRPSHEKLISSLKENGIIKYLQSSGGIFSLPPMEDKYHEVIKKISIVTIDGFSGNEVEQLRMFADKLTMISKGIYGRLGDDRSATYRNNRRLVTSVTPVTSVTRVTHVTNSVQIGA